MIEDNLQQILDLTLQFERQHEEAYQEWGYQMIKVPVAPVDERCDQILKEVYRLSR